MRRCAGDPYLRVPQRDSAAVDGTGGAADHADAVNLAVETHLPCPSACISGGLARHSLACVGFAGGSGRTCCRGYEKLGRRVSVTEKAYRLRRVLASYSQAIRSERGDVDDAGLAEAGGNSTVQLPAAAGTGMNHLPSNPEDPLVRTR